MSTRIPLLSGQITLAAPAFIDDGRVRLTVYGIRVDSLDQTDVNVTLDSANVGTLVIALLRRLNMQERLEFFEGLRTHGLP